MNYCKFCGKPQDRHTEAKSQPVQPRPGDLSICLYCGTICLFDESLNLEPMTAGDLDTLMAEDPDVFTFAIRIQLQIRAEIEKN